MTLPLAYPDAEQVLMDLLRPLAVAAGGRTVTSLPPDPPAGTIWITRIGGGPDGWDITDYPLMRVACYGASRNAAMDLSRDVERTITGHAKRRVEAPGKPSDGVLIDFAMLDTGAADDRDLDPDDRRIIKNFALGFRRQYQLVQA